MKKLAVLVISLSWVSACAPKVTSAPPPFRPQAVPAPVKPPPPPEKTDCEPMSAADSLPFMKYEERKLSIDEAQDLAKKGIGYLNSAKTPGVDPKSKEEYTTDAVDEFVTALLADPYNVDATYNLAATYAIIERYQCSINLLERLLQMREHPSKKASVESKLDKLLGRGKTPLDEDFDDMRADTRFRELIQRAGTPSP